MWWDEAVTFNTREKIATMDVEAYLSRHLTIIVSEIA